MFFRIPPLPLCLFAGVEVAPHVEARPRAMAMPAEVDSSLCGSLNTVGLETLNTVRVVGLETLDIVRVMRDEECKQSEV